MGQYKEEKKTKREKKSKNVISSFVFPHSNIAFINKCIAKGTSMQDEMSIQNKSVMTDGEVRLRSKTDAL